METVLAAPQWCAVGPAVGAFMAGRMCAQITEANAIHRLWTYPLNGIVSILAIAVQPVAAVVALVVAVIFKLIGCCSKDFDDAANQTFQTVIAGFTSRSQIFVRIFNPSFVLEERYRDIPENISNDDILGANVS